MAAVSRDDASSSSAHGAAIRALTDARQNTRKYRFLMERSDRVVEDAIFIDPDDQQHPQKLAHASVLDFHEELAQPEYTVMMDDIWSADLEASNGHAIEIEVPRKETVEKTVTGKAEPDSLLPDRDEIATKTETVSLETLAHKWSGRTITVVATWDSPYHNRDETSEEIRVWLPPKAIKAAYSQLNSALSKIGLLANTTVPLERDPDPI